jgi:hypothetical protein
MAIRSASLDSRIDLDLGTATAAAFDVAHDLVVEPPARQVVDVISLVALTSMLRRTARRPG